MPCALASASRRVGRVLEEFSGGPGFLRPGPLLSADDARPDRRHEICEDMWVPVTPSTELDARGRDRPGEPNRLPDYRRPRRGSRAHGAPDLLCSAAYVYTAAGMYESTPPGTAKHDLRGRDRLAIGEAQEGAHITNADVIFERLRTGAQAPELVHGQRPALLRAWHRRRSSSPLDPPRTDLGPERPSTASPSSP